MALLSKKKIRALKKDFKAGKIRIVELVKKHEVSRTTIYRLSREGKWERAKAEKPKSKGGRPEKYKEQYTEQTTALCMLGYTNKQLADFFGVNEETIYAWQRTKFEFSEALLAGREKAASKIAVSLFQRACGYSHDEEKIFCQDGEIIRAKTKKHYPPEVKAITLWLKNKYPELWRDDLNVKHGLPDGSPKKITIEFIDSDESPDSE